VKKETRNLCSFDVAPQNAKIMATVAVILASFGLQTHAFKMQINRFSGEVQTHFTG
jgi:hypothetical protein